ncbi:hypothetical protein SCARR_05574 [Pontiella sulfatireligans]|uniref:Uncharacterized protein n=1 Tax=Pontiella sulfatireligans TaxID=2750658 RepID=A0A6C2UWH9_9BACT|nr:hypothetical protein SCARR_05574 [Pontiella sulfatireligans]
MNEGCCYTNLLHAQWVSLNILTAAHRLAKETSILQYADALKENLGDIKKSSEITWNLLDMHILDSIRICTCFENYMKARLIEKRFIIHMIIKNQLPQAFKHLANDQASRPIKINEIKNAENLSRRRGNNYSFNSLKPNTLVLSKLLNEPSYIAEHKLNSSLLTTLNRINKSRNALHYLVGDSASYSESILNEFIALRDFVNRKLISRHEFLRVKLGFPDVHKLQKIEPAPRPYAAKCTIFIPIP